MKARKNNKTKPPEAERSTQPPKTRTSSRLANKTPTTTPSAPPPQRPPKSRVIPRPVVKSTLKETVPPPAPFRDACELDGARALVSMRNNYQPTQTSSTILNTSPGMVEAISRGGRGGEKSKAIKKARYPSTPGPDSAPLEEVVAGMHYIGAVEADDELGGDDYSAHGKYMRRDEGDEDEDEVEDEDGDMAEAEVEVRSPVGLPHDDISSDNNSELEETVREAYAWMESHKPPQKAAELSRFWDELWDRVTLPGQGKRAQARKKKKQDRAPDVVVSPAEENVPDPHEIPISVRFGQTAKSLKLSSDDGWLQARQRLATVLSRHPAELKLVYTVPWEKDPVPTTLQDGDDWDNLVAQVVSYIVAEKNKNRGKGAVKPFVVQVSEVVDSLGGGGRVPASAGSGSASTSHKRAATIGKQWSAPSVVESGTNDTTGDATLECDGGELLRQIKAEHPCDRCGSPCVVGPDGKHHKLTTRQLVDWLRLVRIGPKWATTKSIPREIKEELLGASLPPAPQKPNTVTTTSERGAGSGSMSSTTSGQQDYSPRQPVSPQSNRTTLRSRYEESSPLIPRRRTRDEYSDNDDRYPSLSPSPISVHYPTIPDWLREINGNSNRNDQHYNWIQWADAFARHGIVNLQDLASRPLTATDLSQILDAPYGVASCLLSWAQDDAHYLLQAAVREGKRPDY
ncbi:hypothetical protein GSI_13223 [Ganoderma sinense ZZ0214-1]|uniref:Uncharacterized protein n=1 Tax=Ganoderma sinense ZZ0214-1 TaxID=1077348 RepID=A0A2G8RV25_9APHY|nr:hypothetical protein GSI_13223 [Ganoderma sinense ZZ0214-1]